MFRSDPKRRKALSGGTKISPQHIKLLPPANIFTTLSQGMDLQTVGVTPSRWLTWSVRRTDRTELCAANSFTGSYTAGGRPS